MAIEFVDLPSLFFYSFLYLYQSHRIGLRENLQENPVYIYLVVKT